MDLPSETLGRVAEELRDLSKDVAAQGDLLKLACTCTRLNMIVIPVLYRQFSYNCWEDEDGIALATFFRALYKSRGLMEHLRFIRLCSWLLSGRNRIWRDMAAISDDQVYSPDSLGHFLCSHAHNLRAVDVQYPLEGTFLEFHSATIEQLRVRPVFDGSYRPAGNGGSANCYPLEGMLRIDFLSKVISWPKLYKLQIEATSVFFEDWLVEEGYSVKSTSSITDLVLRLGNISDEALFSLLEAPRQLRSLTYTPPTPEDALDEWSPGSYADRLPNTSAIVKILHPFASTLEYLVIGRAGSSWSPRYDAIGSLKTMDQLRFLQVDATMLLGWHHCPHMSLSMTEHEETFEQLSPWTLPALLPRRLEHLTLVIDQTPRNAMGSSLAVLLTECIAAEIKGGGLQYLKRLDLAPSRCDYCLECAFAAGQRGVQGLEIQLKNELSQSWREVFSRLGCTLNVGSSYSRNAERDLHF